MKWQKINNVVPISIIFLLTMYQILSSFDILPFFFSGQDIVAILILLLSIQFILISSSIQKLKREMKSISESKDFTFNREEIEKIELPEIGESEGISKVFIGIQNYLKNIENKKELIDKLLVVSSRITNSNRASVMLYSEKDDELYIHKTIGWNKGEIKLIKATKIKPGEGIAGRVFVEQNPLIVNKPEGLEDFEPKDKYKSSSFVSYPLFSGRNIIGVLNLTENSDEIYEKSELDILKFIINEFSIILENLSRRKSGK